MRRYLLNLPPDSSDLDLVQAYCVQYHVLCRSQCFSVGSKEFWFSVIYTDDTKYITWLQLQYPGYLTEF